jgi:hypothetical protein
MQISYSEIIEFWRETKNALIFKEWQTNYDLKLPYKSIVLECSIEKQTDSASDFESKKHLANRPIQESDDIIWTHDFCNNSFWSATDNSLYIIQPENQSVLELHEPLLVCDKNMGFNGNEILNVIWMSLTAPCPERSGGLRTEYNTHPFVPGESGWIERQRPWNGQEVTQFVFLNDAGVPQYLAIEFKYSSLNDLIFKSDPKEFGHRLRCAYYYRKPTKLRSSKNERIECWLSEHQPLTSPNSIEARAVFQAVSYAEF